MTYSKQLIEKRDAELAKADALVASASAEERALSTEEDSQIASSLDVVRDLDEQIKRHAELEGRAAAAAEARKSSGIDSVVAPAVVKSEARTYSPHADSSFVFVTLSLHSSATTSAHKSVWLVT
jgi:glutaredoxin 2